jgi:hypothetical protein
MSAAELNLRLQRKEIPEIFVAEAEDIIARHVKVDRVSARTKKQVDPDFGGLNF